ncbi:hypothetical protein DFH05DRAFT_1525824 [Lentinula detonsa]|uniref:Ketoreductase (KR) domain-containing protein n=1 Tax=Lentinula detonsa TaxID=2804962 RepID=A0A9W8TX23_9AGAR|nr:hypothetical protein DFH05DRAFT_1517778 [Lentinula detonsa]KAJ3743553.1 hypothetical protein DFH05DRAFT_1525824 [Lentinula detonsa]
MAPSISAIRTLNASFSPLYLPCAVFIGGTSGVGQGIAEAFIRHTKGNAHIIIIGRNSSAAESIIASFHQPTSPSAKHEFVSCDVALMKNVQQTTQELQHCEPGYDRRYLMMLNARSDKPGFCRTRL